MKRLDIYVAASILAFLLGAWYVGNAIRRQAAAAQDLAVATHCTSSGILSSVDRQLCKDRAEELETEREVAHTGAGY